MAGSQLEPSLATNLPGALAAIGLAVTIEALLKPALLDPGPPASGMGFWFSNALCSQVPKMDANAGIERKE